MAFRRPHPRQRTCEEYKAELEEENYHFCSELQIEVDLNRQNKSRINQLEVIYDRCVQEIQTLNGEIERLENASKEEIFWPMRIRKFRLNFVEETTPPTPSASWQLFVI